MRATHLSSAFALLVAAAAPGCASDSANTPQPAGPGHHGPHAGMHGMHAGKGGGAGCPMDGGASATAVPAGVSVVQNEMRLLNHAFHKSITAAALGDVSVIPPLFHEVHGARTLTDQAIAAGTWKPAKGDLAEFKALDAAFHSELEKLVHAAQNNDRPAVVDQLDRLLPSCVACHDAFRVPPAAPPAP